MFSNSVGGSSSLKSGAGTNKKTNSFRGVGGTAVGVPEGDQPNPNGFLSPYEQLEAESEALVSKLLDVVGSIINPKIAFHIKNLLYVSLNSRIP